MGANCNICGSNDWADMNGRSGVRCASCNSLERTRAIKLVLDRLNIPKPGDYILHFAPERGLAEYFARVSPGGYAPVDFDPSLYSKTDVTKFDLTTDGESLPSDHYDLIIHSHVLEHVPCNLAYVFHHLSRALKATGYHIFSVPLMRGHYDEYFGPLSSEEAVRRFGQHDHVRRFGLADISRHLGAIVRINKNYSLYEYADEETISHHNIPASQRSGLHSSTVFVTRKQDYLLGEYERPAVS
ncbi:methyltransferase domain-containing protein [Aquamicrobium sp. LC103]|uniref:methyltransferase domain-containing protein n=1 Tax=Aquamicrobium sp. LC103 TaxID=1120658 RepID=UPI0014858D29|nr:methyltransferase domain-containing protein [Aquamicrobium sp. LC103]